MAAASVATAGLAVAIILTSAAVGIINAAGIAVGRATLAIISLILGTGVSFGGVAVCYLRFAGVGWDFINFQIPSVRDMIIAIVGWILAYVASFIGALAVSIIGLERRGSQVTSTGINDPTLLLIAIPASFLLIGPAEEVLFRGIIQSKIKEGFRPSIAVILASAIFATLHLVVLSGEIRPQLMTIVTLFFPSLIFGSVYEISDNIVTASLVHGAYNSTLFTVAYVSII